MKRIFLILLRGTLIFQGLTMAKVAKFGFAIVNPVER